MSPRRNKGGFVELQLLIYAGIAVGVVFLLGYVYHLGAKNTANEYEAKLEAERAERGTQLLETAVELAQSEAARQDEAVEAARKLAENDASWKGKLSSYVPPDSDRVLPNGWVRYHDERAAGLSYNSGPPAELARAPSGFKDSDALEVIGDNYGLYQQCKERVRELIEKYTSTQKIINDKVKLMKH